MVSLGYLEMLETLKEVLLHEAKCATYDIHDQVPFEQSRRMQKTLRARSFRVIVVSRTYEIKLMTTRCQTCGITLTLS
jgi:hypothetical protein